MENEKYEDLILEFYKDNQRVINNVGIYIPAILMIVLLNAILNNNYSFTQGVLLSVSCLFFVVSIIAQVVSLVLAKDWCDKSLDNSGEDSIELMIIYRSASIIFYCGLFLSIFGVFIAGASIFAIVFNV